MAKREREMILAMEVHRSERFWNFRSGLRIEFSELEMRHG
jgi:hypothetical protein